MKQGYDIFQNEVVFLMISILSLITTRNCSAFVALTPRFGSHRQSSSLLLSSAGEEEPDLFDYFDPLLSPHSYPDGISPNNEPDASSQRGKDEHEINLFDDQILSNREKEKTIASVVPNTDFFDPLLSPHMYPNGTPDKVIGDDDVNTKSNNNVSASLMEPEASEMDNDSPITDPTTEFISLIEFATAPSGALVTEEEEVIGDVTSKETNTLDYFDPTISPHDYPSGAPDKLRQDQIKQKQRVVGVLLIDHGSRNKASNERLEELARLYQDYSKSDNGDVVLVEAAHMEIASPSIPNGLTSLLDQGVDEIVCHPYFLSAGGRHVSEDIPEIIDSAISSLNITVPIVTTEPVGSSTDVMLGAIQSLVKNNLKALRRSDDENEAEKERQQRFGF